MRTLWLTFFALMLLGGVVYSSAQPQADSCPALIAQALASVGNTCGDLVRNSACYGYHDVVASFSDATSAKTFTQPSDRVGLTTLKTINTSPMDTALAKWGIALMSLQANLPDSLPGQNTVFMLLGDTQVENAVPPDQAFTGGAVVQVTTSAAASLFYQPYSTENVLRQIPPNVALTADAVTGDGAWVRVVFSNVPGWVLRTSLAPADSTATLPVISAQTRTPMQAFYLRTGITGTNCTQAPDSLIVQGPQNLMVDINADGADIRLGSTIALRVIPLTADTAALFAPLYPNINQVPMLLELIVIDGHAVLNPGTPDEKIVPTGFLTLTCLSDTQNLGQDGATNDRQVVPGCPWLEPLRWQQADFDHYGALEGVWLNYPIHLPEIPPPPPTDTPTPTPTPTRVVVFVPPRKPTATFTPAPTDTATIRPTDTITATVIPFEVLTDTPTQDG